MKPIPPYPLWIGHAGDGRDFQQVFDAGIQAVVELAAEEAPVQTPRDLISCRFPLVDGAGNDPRKLRLAVTTLANLLEKHVPTLVCCGGGLSRAPAVAAAALALVYQEPPEEILKSIAAHHPTDVVPGLWNEVVTLLESDRL